MPRAAAGGDVQIGMRLLLREGPVFDLHVLELAAFKDLAAVQALDELGVLFAGHDLDAGMAAGASGATIGRQWIGRVLLQWHR